MCRALLYGSWTTAGNASVAFDMMVHGQANIRRRTPFALEAAYAGTKMTNLLHRRCDGATFAAGD